MRRRVALLLLLVVVAALQACAAAAASPADDAGRHHRIAEPAQDGHGPNRGGGGHGKRRPKHPYSSPAGLFIQERASKQLPGPGQHFSFGAVKPWEDIQALLDEAPGAGD